MTTVGLQIEQVKHAENIQQSIMDIREKCLDTADGNNEAFIYSIVFLIKTTSLIKKKLPKITLSSSRQLFGESEPGSYAVSRTRVM